MTYKDALPANTIFNIWNLKGLITNEGLHMLIPWTLSISDVKTSLKRVEFYVRKPTVLTPRGQNSVKVSNSLRRTIAVKECKTEENVDARQEHDPKLFQGKSSLSSEPRRFKGDISTPHKLEVFDRVSGGENYSTISRSKIFTANELKLSIPNLIEQRHFETTVYCRCHKMSKVI